MNGSHYVLMEFSMWVDPEGAVPCVEAIANAAYKPIIAHMERYRYLRDNMELVDRFRELGALIQLNVYSLFDEDDSSIKDWQDGWYRSGRWTFWAPMLTGVITVRPVRSGA